MFEKIVENRQEISQVSRNEDKLKSQIQVLERIVLNKDDEGGKGYDVFEKIEQRLFTLERAAQDVEDKVNMNSQKMISREFKEIRFQLDEDQKSKQLLVSYN